MIFYKIFEFTRLWDVFLLDGEIILTGMSYTLLKLHKSRDLLCFFAVFSNKISII